MKLLITGSSSGIGLRLFRNLTEYDRWGLGRRASSAGLQGSQVLYSSCDVTQWNMVDEVAREVQTKWNYLDAIVHCAGIQGVIGKAMNLDPAEWVSTSRANIEGAYFVARAFFSLLQSSQTRSKVILFSGGGASKPRPNFSAYGCAKTALVRLVETLAEEWRELPIDINIVAPGAINTPMTEEVVELGPEKCGLEEYERAVKQLRSGGDSIENVYSMVRFLLSQKSDGITGKFLSAQWDDVEKLQIRKDLLIQHDIYALRRVTPEDLGLEW